MNLFRKAYVSVKYTLITRGISFNQTYKFEIASSQELQAPTVLETRRISACHMSLNTVFDPI